MEIVITCAPWTWSSRFSLPCWLWKLSLWKLSFWLWKPSFQGRLSTRFRSVAMWICVPQEHLATSQAFMLADEIWGSICVTVYPKGVQCGWGHSSVQVRWDFQLRILQTMYLMNLVLSCWNRFGLRGKKIWILQDTTAFSKIAWGKPHVGAMVRCPHPVHLGAWCIFQQNKTCWIIWHECII